MLNQDICYLYNSVAVYAEYGGIVFAEEEGKNIAKALGPHNKVRSSCGSWDELERVITDINRLPFFSTTD